MVCVCLSSLDERTRFHAIHEYLDAALKKVYGIKTMYVINSKGLNIKIQIYLCSEILVG